MDGKEVAAFLPLTENRESPCESETLALDAWRPALRKEQGETQFLRRRPRRLRLLLLPMALPMALTVEDRLQTLLQVLQRLPPLRPPRLMQQRLMSLPLRPGRCRLVPLERAAAWREDWTLLSHG